MNVRSHSKVKIISLDPNAQYTSSHPECLSMASQVLNKQIFVQCTTGRIFSGILKAIDSKGHLLLFACHEHEMPSTKPKDKTKDNTDMTDNIKDNNDMTSNAKEVPKALTDKQLKLLMKDPKLSEPKRVIGIANIPADLILAVFLDENLII